MKNNKINIKTKYISVSYLQKRFRFGYVKAKRILEMLIEDKVVVVEAEGDKRISIIDSTKFIKTICNFI